MYDTRDSVTTGRGVIVLRVENAYGFHEHSTIAAAKQEAERLATRVGGTFVVLAPVAVVKPAPKTVTEAVTIPDLEYARPDQDGEDRYPF